MKMRGRLGLLLLVSCAVACTEDAPLPMLALPCDAVTCDGVCVDVRFDSRHCGSCGHACPAGQLCSDSQCALACGGGTTRCRDRCVQLDLDPANCGACNLACAQGEVCSAGRCGLRCATGTTLCAGRCVDTHVDPRHCGACGVACPMGGACVEGVCSQVGCGPGTAACGMRCVDLQVDASNCGACGVACTPGDVCRLGACGIDCGRGRIDCGGTCVDPMTSASHCGGCGKACSKDESCVAGACACNGGRSHCGGLCVDLQTDNANCGACATACGARQACVKGACACTGNLSLCKGVCVDTDGDVANCGACGNACPMGKACYGGACALPFSTWRMLGSDPQHSGWNGLEMGGPPAVKATWTASLGMAPLRQAVSEDGRVFVTGESRFGNTNPVWALDAATGKQLWTWNFGNVNNVGYPTVSGGVLFVPQNNHANDTHIWTFDAKTGNKMAAAAMAAQWELYWSPLVVAGKLYSDGGSYGGLYGFDALSGNQLFFTGLEQYDEWSPAWFNGGLYTFVAGNFRNHDLLTGKESWNVKVNWIWRGWSMKTAPVFGSTYGYIISPPDLHAIDVVNHKVAWTANATFSGVAAVANDVVYAITAGNLQARDAKTGAFLWNFPGDAALSYPPVITPKFIYVSSLKNTYAVDIAQHTAAATIPVGGWISVAAGKLFIGGTDGTLSAFAL